MFKKILVIFCLSACLFGGSFDDNVAYYKNFFINWSSNNVARYIFDYFNKNHQSITHNYFSRGFAYNYGYKGDTFYFTIKMPESISIKTYKKMSIFLSDTKKDIQKLLCNNVIFNASLHSNVRLKFEIFNTSNGTTQETIFYTRNSVLACSLL